MTNEHHTTPVYEFVNRACQRIKPARKQNDLICLLQSLTGSVEPGSAQGFAENPAARAAIERLAMDAVMAHECSLGNLPRDVSAEKKGWDIESRDPRVGHLRFIEVKGRHADARDVIVTKNEILASLNAPENGFAHQPVYVRRFFHRELGFAEIAIVFNLAQLLSLSKRGR